MMAFREVSSDNFRHPDHYPSPFLVASIIPPPDYFKGENPLVLLALSQSHSITFLSQGNNTLVRRWESNLLPRGYEPQMQPLHLSALYFIISRHQRWPRIICPFFAETKVIPQMALNKGVSSFPRPLPLRTPNHRQSSLYSSCRA